MHVNDIELSVKVISLDDAVSKKEMILRVLYKMHIALIKKEWKKIVPVIIIFFFEIHVGFFFFSQNFGFMHLNHI